MRPESFAKHSDILLDALLETSRLVNADLCTEKLCAAIHVVIARLMVAENMFVALRNRVNDCLDFVYHVDIQDTLNPDLIHNLPLAKLHKSAAAYVLRSGKSLILTPDKIDQLSASGEIEIVGKMPASWIGVALANNENIHGVLVLQSYASAHAYSAIDLKVLEYVAQHISSALESRFLRTDLELLVSERTSELLNANHRLEREISERERSERTQTALYRISELASDPAINMEALYAGIHQTVATLIYAENFYISCYEHEKKVLKFAYFVDAEDDLKADDIEEIPEETLKRSLTGYVLKTARPLLATKQQIFDLAKREHLTLQGAQAEEWLGVPLLGDSGGIGVIALQIYDDKHRFSEADKELLIFVAQHIAAAIQHRTAQQALQQQVKIRTQELRDANTSLQQQISVREQAEKCQEALYRIADLASSTRNMETFYQTIHSIIAELIYAENFYIALYDRSEDTVSLVYFTDGDDADDMKKVIDTPLEDILNSATEKVLKSARPWLISPKDWQRMIDSGEIRVLGTRPHYWLGVPLFNDGTVVGVIAVQSYACSIKFTPADQDLLEFVSQHVATALERKTAHDTLEREVLTRTKALKNANTALELEVIERKRSESIQSSLYHIANLANRNLSLPSFLGAIHMIVADLMFAENFYIALWSEHQQILEFIYFKDRNSKLAPSNRRISGKLLKKSLSGYLLRTRKALLANASDLKKLKDAREVDSLGTPCVSYLGVPLIRGDTTLGIMAVQSYDHNTMYDESHRELLVFVAQSLTSAIERRRHQQLLEEEVASRTHELTVANKKLQREILHREQSEKMQSALFRIAETPHEVGSLSQLYQELHAIVSDLMYAENFYIAVVNEARTEFNFVYMVDQVDTDMPDKLPIDSGLTGRVYLQNKPIRVRQEKFSDIQCNNPDIKRGPVSNDWLGVPLKSGGKTLGVMVVQSYDNNHFFGQREINILSFVSSHVADTLHRVHSAEKMRQMNLDLAEKSQRAEEANRAKSTFLATMSHEIRTPMNGILGMVSLMSETSMSTQQRDYLDNVTSSARSLLGLINNILDFSKIEEGKLQIERVEFNLFNLLDSMADMFHARINEKQLNFIIDLAPDLMLTQIGDPLRLSQVLTNLIGNAIKFTDRGEIVVRVEKTNTDRLKISVLDAGIGLSEQQMAIIFETFKQADDSTTRRYGGSGLGLSICRKLVELMSGEISVTSQQGNGSHFVFEVDFKSRETPPLKVNNAKLKNVLLITDSTAFAHSWKNLFERFGVRLDVRTSACFLSKQDQDRPSLFSQIFIDDSDENSSGVHTLEAVRIRFGHAVSCFMLCSLTPAIISAAKIERNNQMLSKPVKFSLLLDILQGTVQTKSVPHRSVIKNQTRSWIIGKKILLAEDNRVNQHVARAILEKAGATVQIADNGQIAVDAVKETHFDLILMDMQMPELDGYAASSRIREDFDFDTLPIIALTAHAMKGDREKCMSFGMNDYLSKPLDNQKLFDTLEKWLKAVQ